MGEPYCAGCKSWLCGCQDGVPPSAKQDFARQIGVDLDGLRARMADTPRGPLATMRPSPGDEVAELRERVAWLERCVRVLGSRVGEPLPPMPDPPGVSKTERGE
jgi:hypothetical protein